MLASDPLSDMATAMATLLLEAGRSLTLPEIQTVMAAAGYPRARIVSALAECLIKGRVERSAVEDRYTLPRYAAK